LEKKKQLKQQKKQKKKPIKKKFKKNNKRVVEVNKASESRFKASNDLFRNVKRGVSRN
jgi:hypothetical protein